jgi:hypothetical protein
MAAQDDFQALADLAERLGLEEDESENFITSGMKRLGYKARQMWEDNDDTDSGSGGGDFFSTKRREKRSAQPERQRPREQRRSGGGWQYGSAG